MTVRLEAAGLAVGYDGRVVAGPLSCVVGGGEVVAVVGPNGSGKSTLLRALAGLVRPIHGTVLVDGQDAAAWPEDERSRRVAYVDQAPRFAARMAAWEVIGLGAWRGGGSASKVAAPRVRQVMGELGVERFADCPWPELSQGQRQRVALARALVQDSGGVLVLDEPFAAQDTAATVLCAAAIVRRARRGSIVVASIHDADLARALASHVLSLMPRAGPDGSPGAAAASIGAPEAALSHAALERDSGVPHWTAVNDGSLRIGPDWRRAIGHALEDGRWE